MRSARDRLVVTWLSDGGLRIGELLGRIRDLEAEWTQDAIQHVTTENTTLKQRLRQLTTDNRTLDDASRPPAPTCASKTDVSPSWKPGLPTPAPPADQPDRHPP